jgi:hypothetical protein
VVRKRGIPELTADQHHGDGSSLEQRCGHQPPAGAAEGLTVNPSVGQAEDRLLVLGGRDPFTLCKLVLQQSPIW